VADPLVPTGSAAAEIEIRRSRFLAVAAHAPDENAARERIDQQAQEHPDASHVVYAFVLGPSGDVFGMSDAGEPKGTAGRPVLEVLKGSGITNVALTVVRYFGGTKLGTGGLVRAYTQAAQECLASLPTEVMTPRSGFRVCCPYDAYERVRRILDEAQAVIDAEEFGVSVCVSGQVPTAHAGSCAEGIRDATSGAVVLELE
jgi:uncharacterized YigZ family protein